MYLLLIGTERCCDVAAVGVCGCACVCGGDGCVGDTTNACTMYRVMGVRLAGSMYVLLDQLMYCKPFILYTQCNSFN